MITRFGKRGIFGYPSNAARRLTLKMRGEHVAPLLWFNARKNWGDAVSPYLVSKILGASVVRAYSAKKPHVVGVGSILSRCSSASYIWGSGFLSASEEIQETPAAILALRGRLSKERLESLGFDVPDVLGDPALLMPRFYNPVKRVLQYRVGIVPHYTDMSFFKEAELPADIAVIRTDLGVEAFVDALLKCEVILSSSLHGLIAADAYGIPSAWVKIGDRVLGGAFKFHDYYSCLDEPLTYPLCLTSVRSEHVRAAAANATLHKQFYGAQQLEAALTQFEVRDR